ncbi:saccharopine dehydrogenase family protein [Thermofilum pendens]|uniref:Saccharopine dehydrogenase n=1 Tax=Thermofilum pendens (strain DSM 2475 / Hrk 5) TaxID=368408 RepID=A1RZH0_THEPD|nr:saccharopine dehydrogenase NADP-binding domain-containing protein [Thermofilum pendens]ABL78600.1 Saccharopine dehydrogenase [Thermofilum pendens Hrk 5]
MKIVVVGCGAVGSLVARLAAKWKVADEVLCLDKDVERAKRYLDYPEPLGIPVERADALAAEELKAKVAGYDFLVNSLPTFVKVDKAERLLNPQLMSVALKAGLNYADLACYGGKRRRAEQLSFSKAFSEAGLLALINMGASPGLSNILAREVYEDLDSAESLYVMSLEDQRGSSFVIPWSREEMLNVASPELCFRGRKYSLREPFSESALCNFPEPIGPVRCYSVSNDEAYTIPAFLRISNFYYLAGGSDIEVLRALYRLGILSDVPVKLRKATVTPRELLYHILPPTPSPEYIVRVVKEGDLEDAYFALQVYAEGEVRGERAVSKRYLVFPSQRRVNELMPGATYITYPTALSLLAVLSAVKGRRLRGVVPGEALPGPIRRAVLDYLRVQGITVGEEFRTVA